MKGLFIFMGILLLGMLAYTNLNQEGIRTPMCSHRYRVISAEMGDGFFDFDYEVVVIAKDDLDSLELYVEYADSKGNIVKRQSEIMNDLIEDESYKYQFSPPLSLEISTVRLNDSLSVCDE